MHDPPADLYRRNPHAFLLWAELAEHPRAEISSAEVRKIVNGGETRALAVIHELVAGGMLTKIAKGRYCPANAPSPAPARARKCGWCGKQVAGTRKRFCNPDCRTAAAARKRSETNAAARAAEPTRRCACGCGQVIPRKPRNAHQKYYSRHCEYVATGR